MAADVMTVVSIAKGSGGVAAAEWNLSQVEQQDDWFIAVLDQEEIAAQLTRLRSPIFVSASRATNPN